MDKAKREKKPSYSKKEAKKTGHQGYQRDFQHRDSSHQGTGYNGQRGRGGDRGGRGRGRGQGGHRGGRGAQGATNFMTPQRPMERIRRVREEDIHEAAKIRKDLLKNIATFKLRMSNYNFGPFLNGLLNLLPPQMLNANVPQEVRKYRSYLSRFQKLASSKNGLDPTRQSSLTGFMAWVEWASFEAAKHQTHAQKEAENAVMKPSPHELARAQGNIAKEREHMRALLAMTVQRHNYARRKEGLHALLNHLKTQLADVQAPCRDLEALQAVTHHSVPYALARLVLGMASENVSHAVLGCYTLERVFCTYGDVLTPSLLMSILEKEMTLSIRMRAVKSHAARQSMTNPEDDELENPEAIDDPTKGERNQRVMSILLSLAALIAAKAKCETNGKTKIELSATIAKQVAEALCFCYIEHKGLRILSGNLLLQLLNDDPKRILSSMAVREWIGLAFFKFNRIDYLRPEGVQMLVTLCGLKSQQEDDEDAEKEPFKLPEIPGMPQKWTEEDPLEPSMLEHLASALFRKENVTNCHPMIHPVWQQLTDLLEHRCQAGESVGAHVANFVHNVVVPYRRVIVSIPRQILFTRIAQRLGRMGLAAVDADDRADVLTQTGTVGFAKGLTHVGKATPPAELWGMPHSQLRQKVQGLIGQLNGQSSVDIKKRENPSIVTWMLRELRACLSVHVYRGTDTSYVDHFQQTMLELGFGKSVDGMKAAGSNFNANKAIFMFAESLISSLRASSDNALSASYDSKNKVPAQPMRNLSEIEWAETYLALEAERKTRFYTAVAQDENEGDASGNSFFKARSMVLTALRMPESKRSILFYEDRVMPTLLLLLFFILSVDDPGNDAARNAAESLVPDLCGFYTSGTLATIEVLVDVLMGLSVRPTCPLQVLPLSGFVRKAASVILCRFGRFIQNIEAIDMIVSPLVEGYGVDVRAEQRSDAKKRGKKGKTEIPDEDDAAVAKDDNASATDVEDLESATDVDTEEDGESDDDSETDQDAAEEVEEENEMENSDEEGDAEDLWDEMPKPKKVGVEDMIEDGEQVADPAYLSSLQHMLNAFGGGHVTHKYPPSADEEDKSEVLRSITLAARVGSHLRTPLMIRILQVLLGVMRENVKTAEDSVFMACNAAVQALMRTKHRYFGSFLPADCNTLTMLLADIQTYCRKMELAILQRVNGTKEERTEKAQQNSRIKHRLGALKRLSLTTMHFLCYLAYKNHASEEVRETLTEYYRSIYCDRGWKRRLHMPQVSRDMFHFRHGFAFACLEGCAAKVRQAWPIDGPTRALAFMGMCEYISSFIPRFKGLPDDAREHAAKTIRDFMQQYTLEEICEVKKTMLYDYFLTLSQVLRYNRKIGVDEKWAKATVAKVTDDDKIEITGATARLVAKCEEELQLTPRIVNTKIATPRVVLQKQHEATGRKVIKKKRAEGEKKRQRITADILGERNAEPTMAMRREKQRSRAEIKKTDRARRAELRRSQWDAMTKEEQSERRKKLAVMKQDRMAADKKRKTHMRIQQKRSFERWKSEKLHGSEE